MTPTAPRTANMPTMWTVIGAIVSAFLLLGLVLNLVDPNVRMNEVVWVLFIAVCILPVWAGRKLDARRKQRRP